MHALFSDGWLFALSAYQLGSIALTDVPYAATLFAMNGVAADSGDLSDDEIPAEPNVGYNGAFTQLECNGVDILATCSNPPESSSSSTGIASPPVVPFIPVVLGDPQFVGFLGQKYQIHGISDTVYNLITDATLNINARFVFLSKGQCPAYTTIDGTEVSQSSAMNCFAHRGSYFGELSVLTSQGTAVLISSGGWKKGFSAVTINSQAIQVGEEKLSRQVSLRRTGTHTLTLTAGVYRLELENSDRFINIVSITAKPDSNVLSVVRPHGLLGQTWRKRQGSADDQVKEIEGQVDDYAEQNNELFGTSFLHNRLVVRNRRH